MICHSYSYSQPCNAHRDSCVNTVSCPSEEAFRLLSKHGTQSIAMANRALSFPLQDMFDEYDGIAFMVISQVQRNFR